MHTLVERLTMKTLLFGMKRRAFEIPTIDVL
jgi:hypothetical protein